MIRRLLDRQPRRDRRPRHARLPRAGHRDRRRLLGRRRATRRTSARPTAPCGIGPPPRGRELPVDRRASSTPRAQHRRRRGASRLRLPRRERAASPAPARRRPDLRRPAARRHRAMGSKIGARATDAGGRRAGRAGRDAADQSDARADRGRPSRSASRCWSRRRPAAAARACASCATRTSFDAAIAGARREARRRLRRRHALRRAAGRAAAPRRDPGLRRRARPRRAPVRARVLGAAAAPEGRSKRARRPRLTPAVRQRMGEAAVAAARAVGYRNAGTVEFLLEGAGDDARVLLPRDEHAAAGRAPGHRGGDGRRPGAARSSRSPPASRCRGRRRTLRSAATPSSAASTPRTRRTASCRRPGRSLATIASRVRPGVRVDSGVVEGGEVTVHYDPMLAKLIAHAETRDAAIARARAALRDFDVLGMRTNIPFLLRRARQRRVPPTASSTPDSSTRDGASLGASLPLHAACWPRPRRTTNARQARLADRAASAAVLDPWATLAGWRS